MIYIELLVRDKHISCKQVYVVADNTDYTLTFEFVGGWNEYPDKKILLVEQDTGKFHELDLLDNANEILLHKFTRPVMLHIGVTAKNGDAQISTDSTLLKISPSILTEAVDVIASPDNTDLLSKYYSKYDSLISSFEDAIESIKDKRLDKAVIYDEQVLTDEQKAQARENIGAAKESTYTEEVTILAEADMLPSVYDTNGKILTDSNGNVILRY